MKITSNQSLVMASILAFLFFVGCGNPEKLTYADDSEVQKENTFIAEDSTFATKTDPVIADTSTATVDTVCVYTTKTVVTTDTTKKVTSPKKVEVVTKTTPKKVAPKSTSHVYVVQKGDTKYSISKKLDFSIQKLETSNPKLKNKSYVISPGEHLYYWKTEK